jgi:uncharacterized CHY-type Zn-finger protein
MQQLTIFKAKLLNELEKGAIKCGSCKTEKPIEEFGSNSSNKNGKNSYCKDCALASNRKYYLSPEAKAKKKARNKAYDATERGKNAKKVRNTKWRANHPEQDYQYVRERDLKYHFNLTQAEYDAMLASQGGVCAICKQIDSRKRKDGSHFSLSVDHNHATGEIRALLCGKCNTALAHFEDYEFFNAALAYLEKFASTKTTEIAS